MALCTLGLIAKGVQVYIQAVEHLFTGEFHYTKVWFVITLLVKVKLKILLRIQLHLLKSFIR